MPRRCCRTSGCRYGGEPMRTIRAAARWERGCSRWRAAERAAEAEPPPPAEEASAPVAQRQLHARVSAALGELAPQQRDVVELAYFGGLSQSEIAARLGAPLGTVKSWTRQALTRLRALVPQEDWT